jgi:hypothetical protein
VVATSEPLYSPTTTPDANELIAQYANQQTVITTPNVVAPDAPTTPFDSGNIARKPEEPAKSKQEVFLHRDESQLAENCRLIETELDRLGLEVSRWQLEVLKNERWNIILAYELSDDGAVRQEALPTGGMWSMRIDLPSQLALDMIKNDLSTNWETYCKKYLAGKRLSA